MLYSYILILFVNLSVTNVCKEGRSLPISLKCSLTPLPLPHHTLILLQQLIHLIILVQFSYKLGWKVFGYVVDQEAHDGFGDGVEEVLPDDGKV